MHKRFFINRLKRKRDKGFQLVCVFCCAYVTRLLRHLITDYDDSDKVEGHCVPIKIPLLVSYFGHIGNLTRDLNMKRHDVNCRAPRRTSHADLQYKNQKIM